MLKMRELMPWSREPMLRRGTFGFEPAFEAFYRDLDSLFGDLWRGLEMPMVGAWAPGYGTFSPRLDMTEDEKAFHLTVELPGMDEDDIEVMLGDDMLTIKGERKLEKEEAEKGYVFHERAFGSFYRRIPLPKEIVADKIEAVFENGLLTVTLPKTPEMQKKTKKIPLNVRHGVKRMVKKAA